jgi:hypothetical protein
MITQVRKKLNLNKLVEAGSLHQLKTICLHNFYAFCHYLTSDKTSYDFNLDQKWVYHITKELQDFTYSQESNRMIVNACPRLGKTTIATIFYGAWYIAKYPNRKILFLTASDGTLEQLSFAFSEVINNKRFKILFPNFSFKNNTIKSKITYENGFVQFVVAGSNVTGRGFHLAIFDDFINPDHIRSAVRRTSAVEKFRRFLGRKEYNPATKVLIVEQRFAINDITATAKEMWEGYLSYRHIVYPYQFQKETRFQYLEGKSIVFKEGEYVDVKFDDKDKLTIQRERTIQVWQAEYLQDPQEITGDLIKASHFTYYTNDEIDNTFFNEVFIVCDTASKEGEGNDFSVLTCWGVAVNSNNEAYLYLLDFLRGKWDFNTLEKMVISFYNRNSIGLGEKTYYGKNMNSVLHTCYIEDASSGTTLLSRFKNYISNDHYYSFKSINETFKKIMGTSLRVGKYERFSGIGGRIQSGDRIKLPNPNFNHRYYQNVTLGIVTPFLQEVCSFTHDNTHQHDDITDCLIYACHLVWSRKIGFFSYQ